MLLSHIHSDFALILVKICLLKSVISFIKHPRYTSECIMMERSKTVIGLKNLKSRGLVLKHPEYSLATPLTVYYIFCTQLAGYPGAESGLHDNLAMLFCPL